MDNEKNTDKNSTWSENEYAGVYSRLDKFAPKELHDHEIADLITSLAETEEFESEQIRIAEVGAGPAPISRILNGEKFDCKAFDINPDMGRDIGNIPYDSAFDLTDPTISEEEKGKYDFVVMENVLYATALSPEGTRKYTPQEAEIMRLTSLKKSAALLKPGGFLVISDPLKTTENFGLKRMVEFLEYDKKARLAMYNEEKNVGSIALEYIMDKQIKEVLKRNKKIMERAVLLDENEMINELESIDMFEEIVYKKSNTYLGSNMTLALRRNGEEMKEDAVSILGEPIILEGKVHRNILEWVGRFRRKIYAQSNTTDNLPEVDRYDLKEGVLVVYPTKNKLELSAVATLQPSGEIGLDAEELMVPEEGEFYEQLTNVIYRNSEALRKAVDSGRTITYAEIRRLAADNLGYADVKVFLNSLCGIFKDYAKRNDIDIVLFMSDNKRFTMFNRANGEIEFKKVDGFALKRDNPELQTMMISAANYFFKDWEKFLTEDELTTANQLRKLLINGDTWEEKIKDHPNREDFEKVVTKILTSAPDNVSIYYTDYSMEN
jgi:hypothetical protein